MVAYSTQGVKINTKSIEDHRTTITLLDQMNIQYFTYPTYLDKIPKIVLKGLPPETSGEEIMKELVSNKYPVMNIRQLRKTNYAENGHKTYTNLPIWVLTLTTSKSIKDFENLRTLFYFKIKIELYQGRVGTIQCFNCQQYGHKAGWCTAHPKCMRCAEDHASRTSTEKKRCAVH